MAGYGAGQHFLLQVHCRACCITALISSELALVSSGCTNRRPSVLDTLLCDAAHCMCLAAMQEYSPAACGSGGGTPGVPNFKAFRKRGPAGGGLPKRQVAMEAYCEALVDGEAFLKCAEPTPTPLYEGMQAVAARHTLCMWVARLHICREDHFEHMRLCSCTLSDVGPYPAVTPF